MEHARKMVLMDPRVLDTLRSPPPPTDTVGKKVQALDDEMKTILDRKDLDDGTKVTLYNQVLQRYNVVLDKRVKEPIRVVSVGKEVGPELEKEEEVSGTEADVVNTVPKSLQAKDSKETSRGTIVASSYTRVSRLLEVTWWTSFTTCCVRERPTIRRVGSRSHGNSAPSTYPWSWSVTSPGEPTYDRQRLPPLLRHDDNDDDDR